MPTSPTLLPPVISQTAAQSPVARRSGRQALTALLMTLLAVFLPVAGWYALTWRAERRLEAENAAYAAEKEMDILRAIQDGKAIKGMSEAEVLKAKGRPFEVKARHQLTDGYQKIGGYVLWLYALDETTNRATDLVLFDANGHVLVSDDMARAAGR